MGKYSIIVLDVEDPQKCDYSYLYLAYFVTAMYCSVRADGLPVLTISLRPTKITKRDRGDWPCKYVYTYLIQHSLTIGVTSRTRYTLHYTVPSLNEKHPSPIRHGFQFLVNLSFPRKLL